MIDFPRLTVDPRLSTSNFTPNVLNLTANIDQSVYWKYYKQGAPSVNVLICKSVINLRPAIPINPLVKQVFNHIYRP